MYPLIAILLTFGNFTNAVDLDSDIEGNIYVVDIQANILVQYSPKGDSLRSVSGYGSGTLQFDSPIAVCARRGNDLLVADYNNHRIQWFNRQLDYVTTIYTRDNPDERKQFGYPRDVNVTRQGDILIVDGENRRIVMVNTFGQVERAFGDVNAGTGRLIDPMHVEVDSRDNIYVLDEGRIKMFDPFGNYLRVIPSPLRSAILSIAVNNDTLILTDSVALVRYDTQRQSFLPQQYQAPHALTAIRAYKGQFLATGRNRAYLLAGDEHSDTIQREMPYNPERSQDK